MLCIMCILNHVFEGFDIPASQHHKTHGQTNCFPIERGVRVKNAFEIVIVVFGARRHACNPKTERPAVLNDFFGSILELLPKKSFSTAGRSVLGLQAWRRAPKTS